MKKAATRNCPIRIRLIGLGVIIFSATSFAEPGGQELFEKRCVVCHELPDPGQPPLVGWERQLELMAPLARLEPNQRQEVLSYLSSHLRDAVFDASLDEDRSLFEDKCSRCHTLDRILLSPLRGEDLKHVVNRMQSRSGTDWLSDLEVERVLAYLSEAPREPMPITALSSESEPADIFEVRCSACHSLERIFGRLAEIEGTETEEFWSHTISRMRGKAPQWMPESEASQILEYLQSLESASP